MSFESDLAERRLKEEQEELTNLALARSIAACLGGTIKPCPEDRDYGYNNRFVCLLADDKALNLRFNDWHNKGKICVSGDYPRDSTNRTYGKSAGSINVSSSKTPEQIAKDITRRFLPEYNAAFATALQSKTDADEYTRKKEANKDLLCSTTGVTRNTYNDHVSVRIGGIYGEVTYISTDGTCSAELRNVPIDLLKRMLALAV